MTSIGKKLSACAAALALVACALLLAAASARAQPQPQQERKQQSLVAGVALEPVSGLDPTAGAALPGAEMMLYNVFETLTKILPDGSVAPLLAERWSVSSDRRTYTFRLRRDAWFHNGRPFDSAAVKYSFERAAAEDSNNRDRHVFRNMAFVGTPDAATVVIGLKAVEPELPFLLGQAGAAIVEPGSAPTNATQPVGTGPYKLEGWTRGSSLTLARWPGWRQAGSVAIARVTFRFIGDAQAQVAALLAGEVDVFSGIAAGADLERLRRDARFQVLVGQTRAKALLAMNNRRKALDDVRVRRAVAAAIDRRAVIEAALGGHGVPIGSHYVPGMPGHVDTTGINPHDVQKAARLLKEAGVATPIELGLKLPPAPWARRGGEAIAAQLARVGIVARIENVDWPQWLASVRGRRDYDLALALHADPHDLDFYAAPDNYWGYRSPVFNDLYQRISAARSENDRSKLLGNAQRLLATDAVNAFLFQPQWITVADRRLQGLRRDMPIVVVDLAALTWQ